MKLTAEAIRVGDTGTMVDQGEEKPVRLSVIQICVDVGLVRLHGIRGTSHADFSLRHLAEAVEFDDRQEDT